MNHLANGGVAVGAPGSIARKVAELRDGQRIVTNDTELDAMAKFDGEFMNTIATVPNPERVGIKDQYIAWSKRTNASSLFVYRGQLQGSGCGRMVHVIGTNGGKMPCGARLDGEVYLCENCEKQ